MSSRTGSLTMPNGNTAARTAPAAASPAQPLLLPPPTSPPVSSSLAHVASARGSLQERLRRRHCAALEAFQSTLQKLNSEVDTRQHDRLVALKAELQAGHRHAATVLEEEQQHIAQHEALLDAQCATLRETDEGVVLPLFVDEFHPELTKERKIKTTKEEEEGDVQNNNNEEEGDEDDDEAAVLQAQMLNKPRVAEERRRVAELALTLRTAFDARVGAIERCMREISAEEQHRGHAIQDELRVLMLELAKISYIGVTDAHVLAQRVLHSVNGSMAENYGAYHTLLHQLRQREVLKQQALNEQLARLYGATLRRLARSHVYAVCTLMRSAFFRRPARRLRAVAEVRRVSLAARSGGRQFLASLAVMLGTLRVAPSLAEIAQANCTESGHEGEARHMAGEDRGASGVQRKASEETRDNHTAQAEAAGEESERKATAPLPLIRCGGTAATGWLREYNPNVSAPVFTFLTDHTTGKTLVMTSSTVVDEWRMKASVVLRHTLGDCLAVVEAIRAEEERRVGIAAQLRGHIVEDLRWIYRPTTEELTRLQSASLAAPKLDGGFSRVLQEGSEEANSAVHNTPTTAEGEGEGDETQKTLQRDAAAMTQHTLEAITRESGWFVHTIEAGLRRSHAVLEGSLLTAYESVLRLFEKATEALVQTACRIHGFVRQCHRGLCEAGKDHADDIAREEAHYAELCEKILHAGSHEVAEGLFAEGLRALQHIAALHSHYHRRTIDRIQAIQGEVRASTAQACRLLQHKLGVESVAETMERRAEERRARREAALAEQRLREQQMQQQQARHASGRQKKQQQQQVQGRNAKADGAHRERTASSAHADTREESSDGPGMSHRNHASKLKGRSYEEDEGEDDDEAEEMEEGEEGEEEEEEEVISYPQIVVPLTNDKSNNNNNNNNSSKDANESTEEVYNLIAPLQLIEHAVSSSGAANASRSLSPDVHTRGGRHNNANMNTASNSTTSTPAAAAATMNALSGGARASKNNNNNANVVAVPGRQSRQGSLATTHHANEPEPRLRRASSPLPLHDHHTSHPGEAEGNTCYGDEDEYVDGEDEAAMTRIDSMAQLVSVVGELIVPEAVHQGGAGPAEEGQSSSVQAAVAAAVRATYEPLLRDTLQRAENFITAAEIIAWKDELRLELLRWLVALRRACTRGMASYCTQSIAELEERTNWVLRHHRRRPASFQADFYEVRQRELETKTNAAEKYCARLRERLATLQERWLQLQHAEDAQASDAALLEELNQLATTVSACASMTALQSHGRRAESLMQHYLDVFQQRYRGAMEQLERQYAVMQQECQHYLDVRAKELRSEIASAASTNALQQQQQQQKQSPAEGEDESEAAASFVNKVQDLVTQRVQRIQGELQDSLAAMQDGFTREQQSRAQAMEQLKSRYAAAARQRTAELLLLGSLQEIATGVKLQVQSITQRSETEASALDELLKELERILRGELQPAAVVATLRLLTQRDDTQLIQAAGYGGNNNSSNESTSHNNTNSSSSSKSKAGKSRRADSLKKQAHAEPPHALPSAEEFAGELREAAYAELSSGLRECAIELQRSVTAGPAAELLHVLDKLRTELYTRGVRLDALVASVELVHVLAEEYIVPRSMANNINTNTSGSGGGGQGDAASAFRSAALLRKTRSNAGLPSSSSSPSSSSAAAGNATSESADAAVLSSYESPRLDAIPHVLRYEAELRQRIAEATAEAQRLLQSFFEAHPAPLAGTTTTNNSTNTNNNSSASNEGNASETGTMAGLMRDFQNMCQAQLTSAKAHITKAQQRYCRQVHRLHKLLPKVPQFLSIAVYALACSAVERRLRRLMQSFAKCYGTSAALRAAHQRAVKVSLGARCRAEQLNSLASQEQLRQRGTTEAVMHFWTCALCELEDEATMHAVRSFQSTTTLLRLLKGLVGPAHLIECELEADADSPSNASKAACGLRQLLRLKANATARAAQVRHWQEQQQQRLASAAAVAAASHARRDRRLQETMPLPKVDPGLRSHRGAHTANTSDGNAMTMMMRGGGTDVNGLPLTPYVEVRCEGLPLHLVRPHETFNAMYPAYAIESFVSLAGQYFPVSAIVTEAAETLAATMSAAVNSSSNTSNNLNTLNYVAATGSTLTTSAQAAAITTTSTSSNRNKGKAEETDEDKVVSPPFFIAPSALSTDTVDFAVDSVALFNATTEEMVGDMNGCFAAWYAREQQWGETWAMTLDRLLNPAAATATTATTPATAATTHK